MHEAGCSGCTGMTRGGWDGEGGGRDGQDREHMYTHGWFIWMYGKNHHNAAAAAKSLQSCPTLCDPTDGSPRGSPIPGILQARTLEWVAISFSNAWECKVKVKSLSCVRLLATSWTAAYQAPPSMGFSRQEYWSGLHAETHYIIKLSKVKGRILTAARKVTCRM